MWIAIRLIAALVGFLLRHFAVDIDFRSTKSRKMGGRAGTEYRLDTKTRRNVVKRCRLSIPSSTGVVFAFASESDWDSFFKFVGLSREFQTGDSRFYSAVYIAADHSVLRTALAMVSAA